MSDDGISSVADLTIMIDASTEKFANAMKTTQGIIDTLAEKGATSLGKFDGVFASLGDKAASLPGKFNVLMAQLTPVLAQAQALYGVIKDVAEKVGVKDDVDQVEAAFGGLFSSIKLIGVDAMQAVGYETGNLRSELIAARVEADKTLDKLAGSKTTIGRAVVQAVSEIEASLAESVRGIESLSERQTRVQIEANERAKATAKEAAAVVASTMGAYMVGVGDAATAAIGEIDRLEQRATDLKEQLEKTLQYGPPAPELADMAKYLETLEKQNREIALRNEVMGQSKSAAEAYLAVRRAELDAEQQGKIIGEEDLETLRARAAEKRKLLQVEEDYTAAAKRRADAEREIARQERAIDGITTSMQNEIDQIELKIAATERGTVETAREVFVQKQLAAAKRANIELGPADIENINASADAYELLIRRQQSVVEQMELIKSTNQALSSAVMREFDGWTRGGEFNVRRMTASILAEFAKIAFQAAVIKPLLGGGGGGAGGLLGSLFGGLFGGGGGGGGGGGYLDGYTNTLPFGGPRANGGPVDPGHWYMVGERGPEPFVPATAGTIIPHESAARMGAASSTYAPSVSVSIDARGATVDAIAELQRLKAELPTLIVSTMGDARERGLA